MSDSEKIREVNISGELVESTLFEVVDGRLTIPEGETFVLEESYHGREDIEEIILPASMRTIGPIAFAECPELKRIYFNEGLEEIGDGAFLGAELLSEIKLPESLKTIGPMAFWGCGLTSVRIPEATEFIGESCFWECSELTRADVLNPDAVIEQDAFGDCEKLGCGYMAPGYPKDNYGPSDLLFTILWASEYDKHASRPEIGERAMKFISDNNVLILDNIIRTENTAAMRGIMHYGLFTPETIERGLRESVERGQTELSSLFLTAGATQGAGGTEEFEL